MSTLDRHVCSLTELIHTTDTMTSSLRKQRPRVVCQRDEKGRSLKHVDGTPPPVILAEGGQGCTHAGVVPARAVMGS